MRTWIACLGLCLLTAVPHGAGAQSPDVPIDSPRSNRYQNIRRPMTPAEQLIYQRAVSRAIQREARLEAHKWAGQSPLRPTLAHSHRSSDRQRLGWAAPYRGFSSGGLSSGGYYSVPFGY